MRSADEMAAHLTSIQESLAAHQRQAQVETESVAYLHGVTDALMWALHLDEASLEAETVASGTSRGRAAMPDGLPDEVAGEAEARLRLAEGTRDRSQTLIRSVRALPFGPVGDPATYLLIACPDAPGTYPQPAWARLVPNALARRLAHAILEALTPTNRA